MTVPGLFAPGALTPTAAPAPAGLRVLGLDLSIACTGMALPDGTTERIKTRPKDGDKRLCIIRDRIHGALDVHRPHVVAIEDLPRDSHTAKINGFVHGIVRAELADFEVPYALVFAATLKSYACDHGRADKRQLADAAFLAAGAEFPGDLDAKGHGGDMCDAWWLRAAAHDHYGAPLFSLPEAQRARLNKVDWPVISR